MAKKIISKNDLGKNAIVLTEDLSRVLHQRGVFPALGGGNPLVVHGVRMFLVNTGEDIVVSYYASLRNAARAIEERIWCAELGAVCEVGAELNIDFQTNRFVVEIRPSSP